jgi:uncharacterized C2H2 Zn-finger protein
MEHEEGAPQGGAPSPDMPVLAADFMCSVCGAVFTTDEDRAQHLKKEAHGELHGEPTKEEMDAAKAQERLNAGHKHHV